jgi:tRNA threonylcarbamoyl adenosine modification protein (Sua5/YciO/YrdC/YwlC family)
MVVADAFKPSAVQALRDARGMASAAPVSVLSPGLPTLHALVQRVEDEVQALVNEFWPGPLTLILPGAETLSWDLGSTAGTVALNMPTHRIVLELLSETGPLAFSSASRAGEPGCATAAYAQETLGESVTVYLAQDGSLAPGLPSTVVDATGLARPQRKLRLAREGAIPAKEIYAVVPVERFA